ncbi:response regulator transcription factor [Terrimonas sp. NA20]|uniref:Response regulator transcription factor n=1 Tax=Terrimonas ginsenosidimutans TaxID=2908004 RepID=A0ABS9KVB8_9BACT|nr:response regulator transcription factor [Terrimonas ginsenosidimutans]MCG2616265.1 response regulator transcription factor [Terrimonas ginsenosidimutans]
MKILLIEDEPKIGLFLCEGLTDLGHTCDHITDGAAALKAAFSGGYDLIILDLLLPTYNGFEILETLKGIPSQAPPILVLSALSDTKHVIRALDLGAIDYIKKPFDFEELLARIRKIKRMQSQNPIYHLQIDDLQLDLLTREVTRSGHNIQLSSREFMLLEFLMNRPNQVVTKAEILKGVWKINFDPGSNIVEVHMYQLRKKLELDNSNSLIQTVVGRGYMIMGDIIKS